MFGMDRNNDKNNVRRGQDPAPYDMEKDPAPYDMEKDTVPQNAGRAPAPRGYFQSLLSKPRKAVSGIVFTGAIVAMLLMSLVFSLTVAVVGVALEMSVEDVMQTEAYKYCAYLLYQIALAAIVAVYMKVYRERPRAFGWRGTHWRFFLIGLALACGLLFSLNWLNEYVIKFFGLIGYEAPASSLPSVQGFGLAGVLLVVAVLPAVFEETVFRGIVLEGIKDVGTVAACLLGGLLFSVFHQSPAQTAYQFVCGAAYTLLAIRAGSLLPAAMMHFVNNALIVLDVRFGFLSGVTGGGAAALYAVSGVCLAAALAWLIFLEKDGGKGGPRFPKKGTKEKAAAEMGEAAAQGGAKPKGAVKPFLLAALPGLILCAVLWIYNFIGGLG